MRQIWAYKARDSQGNSISGEIESESKEYVLESLANRGLIPTTINSKSEKISLSNMLGNFGSAHREHLIVFTKKLMTLYRAGIPLLRALTIIERGANELGMEDEINSIKQDLQAGKPLSKALEQYPNKFPAIYVASIAAGEASGTLDEVLEHLALLVEKEMVLARQIKSAMRYPVIVIVAISIAIFVLMSFVVPKFANLYGKFGAELPTPTKIVMGTSAFFSSYWYVILIAVALFLFALKKFISTPKGRLLWDELMLKIPLLGDLILKANIARFANMLTSLFRSGVPMVTCLNILKETASNKVIASEIGELADSFEKGQEVGLDSAKKYKHFPNMALEMFQVGLESGSIESIMGELANHYEMELEYKSRHLAAMIEPLLTIFIGIIVMVLALSIFLPMWNLIKVFR
ncbi:MAG: type II secretion system F family protein [candidate division Zixibacteria bacterium]|nr:type II secretion system F family protein [candidate division Zixibacteria bacterium]